MIFALELSKQPVTGCTIVLVIKVAIGLVMGHVTRLVVGLAMGIVMGLPRDQWRPGCAGPISAGNVDGCISLLLSLMINPLQYDKALDEISHAHVQRDYTRDV